MCTNDNRGSHYHLHNFWLFQDLTTQKVMNETGFPVFDTYLHTLMTTIHINIYVL